MVAPVVVNSIDSAGLPQAVSPTDPMPATPIDPNGNPLVGVFSVGVSGATLVGTTAWQTQLTGSAAYVRFDIETADALIQFGDANTVWGATTAGTRFRVGTTETIAVPAGADRFAFVGDTASINFTLVAPVA